MGACIGVNTLEGLTLPVASIVQMMRSAATALAVLMLAGCNDEDPAVPSPDPLRFAKRLHVRDIARNLTQAYDECERRNFDASIALCNYVLAIEPDYCVAVEFLEDLKIAKTRLEEGDEFYFSFLMSKVNNWKKLTDGDEVLIPYVGGTNGDILTYPHLGLPRTAETEPVFPSAPESISASKMD